jgi:hypothetical protein
MDNRIEPKSVIKSHFNPEKYMISSAMEELNSWDSVSLKQLIFELGQSQKGLNKSIMQHIIKQFILYTFELKSFDELVLDNFVISTTIK